MGLDGVELILAAEEEFGVSISDGDAESMITPKDMIEVVCRELDVGDDLADADFEDEEFRVTACMPQRAFYKIRSEIINVTGVERGEVRLETRVEELFPKFKGKGVWGMFVERLGLDGLLSWHGSWLSGHCAPGTVKDVVDSLVKRNPTWLGVYGRWSRELVRERVREIVSAQLEVSDFDDDDEFVRDLGMA